MYDPESGFQPVELIGKSLAFVQEAGMIPVIARCTSSVVISGEPGTGKESYARNIHALGPRRTGPFVSVHCAALSAEALDKVLFGGGKASGAQGFEPGLIAKASGGTLFLDEADSIAPIVQVKLLDFLQEKLRKTFCGIETIKADVRFIAAMAVEPEAAVEAGRLRQDLYFRLNTIAVKLPPLRERQEDIPILSRYFLEGFARQSGGRVLGISPEAMRKLVAYGWPGNVAELQHVLERATALSASENIGEDDVRLPEVKHGLEPFKEAKEKFVSRFEKDYVQSLLATYGGNISRAAAAAKKHRRAFLQLIQKHQIDVQRFRQ